MSLGQYDECLSVNEEDLDIKGKNCMALLPFAKIPQLLHSKMYHLFDMNVPMTR